MSAPKRAKDSRKSSWIWTRAPDESGNFPLRTSGSPKSTGSWPTPSMTKTLAAAMETAIWRWAHPIPTPLTATPATLTEKTKEEARDLTTRHFTGIWSIQKPKPSRPISKTGIRSWSMKTACSNIETGNHMLEQTFIHIQGIGPKTEEKIWGMGIRSWRDFLSLKKPVFPPAKKSSHCGKP